MTISEMKASVIDSESISLYEIENDPTFDATKLSKEEREKLDQEYDQGIKTALAKINYSCDLSCIDTTDDEDTDKQLRFLRAYTKPIEFAVISESNRGKLQRIHMIITHCKKCNRVKFFGNPKVIANMMLDAFIKYAQNEPEEVEDLKAEEGSQSEFLMTNLETGEVSDATDIMNELLGKK